MGSPLGPRLKGINIAEIRVYNGAHLLLQVLSIPLAWMLAEDNGGRLGGANHWRFRG